MEEGNASIQFIKVTKESVISFLGEAQQRVVIAKAGYFTDEIEQLLALVKENVRCDIYVDTDENSIRYGFGEQEALELINQNLEILNVQSSNYIRLALVIVDDTVMVYSPVALSWEEVPEQIDFPNGFIGGKEVASSLLRQIEGEHIQINVEGLNLDLQTCPVVQKAPEKIKREISTTNSKLKENPPVNPADLRKTTFYRHKYKLLKMTLHGVRIKKKLISLRPFNNLFPKTNLRLKSSWNVLTREDVESLVAINEFLETVNKLADDFTLDVKRYGVMIKTKDKKTLEKSIHSAADCLKNCLGKTSGPVKTVSTPKSDTGANQNSEEPAGKNTKPKVHSLASILEESRSALINHLFTQAMAERGCWKKLFANDQTLYRLLQRKKIPEDEAVKQAVETFVDHRLNFPKPQKIIDLIHVEFDYYDISDELLGKKEFAEIVENYDLQVRDYQDGYENEKQMALFEQLD